MCVDAFFACVLLVFVCDHVIFVCVEIMSAEVCFVCEWRHVEVSFCACGELFCVYVEVSFACVMRTLCVCVW